jgi:hypothetical protein
MKNGSIIPFPSRFVVKLLTVIQGRDQGDYMYSFVNHSKKSWDPQGVSRASVAIARPDLAIIGGIVLERLENSRRPTA